MVFEFFVIIMTVFLFTLFFGDDNIPASILMDKMKSGVVRVAGLGFTATDTDNNNNNNNNNKNNNNKNNNNNNNTNTTTTTTNNNNIKNINNIINIINFYNGSIYMAHISIWLLMVPYIILSLVLRPLHLFTISTNLGAYSTATICLRYTSSVGHLIGPHSPGGLSTDKA